MQAAAVNPSLQCHSIMQNCQMHITTAVLLLNKKKVSVMGLDAPFILFLFNLILLKRSSFGDGISSYQVRHKFQQ